MKVKNSAYQESSSELGTKGPYYFNEDEVIHELKHFLPAQAPLKDFIHHNTLHAFQNLNFFEALKQSSEIFGYKVFMSLDEYRDRYKNKQINDAILARTIQQRKGAHVVEEWKEKMISKSFHYSALPRIGSLRSHWKRQYHIDLDSWVHPTLFRVICSYLDQGVSIWNFPIWNAGFLSAVRELERNSFTSFFRTKRAKTILLEGMHSVATLLNM